jgi:hypothetical protein
MASKDLDSAVDTGRARKQARIDAGEDARAVVGMEDLSKKLGDRTSTPPACNRPAPRSAG